MRKNRRNDFRAEYDFSGGVRGKYARRYAKGTNIVRLDPDVSEVFPDARAVNRALRALLKIALPLGKRHSVSAPGEPSGSRKRA